MSNVTSVSRSIPPHTYRKVENETLYIFGGKLSCSPRRCCPRVLTFCKYLYFNLIDFLQIMFLSLLNIFSSDTIRVLRLNKKIAPAHGYYRIWKEKPMPGSPELNFKVLYNPTRAPFENWLKVSEAPLNFALMLLVHLLLDYENNLVDATCILNMHYKHFQLRCPWSNIMCV